MTRAHTYLTDRSIRLSRLLGPAALLAVIAVCNGGGTQPPPDPPVVAPRPNVPDPQVVYGGFAIPFGNDTPFLELDAPLGTDAGNAYYSMSVNVRIAGLNVPSLSWVEEGASPVAVTKVEGPCDPVAGPPARALMESRALVNTGRVVPASHDAISEAHLDAGEPVYWVTCEEDAPGEVILSNPTRVHYNIAVLLPEAALGDGGVLEIRATTLAADQSSAPIELRMAPAPTYLGVAGDSVAWGQGLMEGQKQYQLLFQDLVQRTGSGRLRRNAHSGAIINASNGSTTIAGAGGCSTNQSLHGEVPRGSPNVQCQVKALVAEECRTPTDELGVVPVPRFVCGGTDDPVADMTTFDIDAGPRFDFVMMTGCINDIGPFAMLLGQNGLDHPAALTDAILTECDVATNGLGDLRQFLPNATIAYLGYHYIVSTNTDYSRTGCLGPPGTLLPGVLNSDPVQAMLAIAGADQAGMAERAALFRETSTLALLGSATNLNQVGDGRGAVIYVDVRDDFQVQHATLGVAARSFGLACPAGGGFLVPVDPVAGVRVGPCSQFANPNGTNPNSTQEESCLRASAFHPDPTGSQRMFERTRGVLTEAGRYPPPP